MWIKNTDLVDIARAALERHDNMILALRIIHDEHADYDIQPGEYCRPSYRWEDGECTDEVLSGTSAIDARMLLGYNGAPTSYYGDRILVITGTDQVRGEDDCEVVINDAIVLEVVDIKSTLSTATIGRDGLRPTSPSRAQKIDGETIALSAGDGASLPTAGLTLITLRKS